VSPFRGLVLRYLPVILREMDRTFGRSSGRCHVRKVYELGQAGEVANKPA